MYTQNFILKKLRAGEKVGKFSKPQIKITCILIYYMLMSIMGQVSLIYYEVKGSVINLAAIAVCKSLSSSQCQLDEELINVFISLSVTAKVMLALLPVMILIFTFDLQNFKELFKKLSVCSGTD